MDKHTRSELVACLDDLKKRLIEMIDVYPESDLMDAFAGEAEMIEARTAPDDLNFFHDSVQCMLRDAGLIPGDDEPCSADAQGPETGTDGPV